MHAFDAANKSVSVVISQICVELLYHTFAYQFLIYISSDFFYFSVPDIIVETCAFTYQLLIYLCSQIYIFRVLRDGVHYNIAQ